jgi:hypothetical protein
VKDIRYEVFLGWNDIKKRDSKKIQKSLISRIRKFYEILG